MKISKSILKLHKINLPPLPVKRQSLLKDKLIKKAKMNINFLNKSPKKIKNKSYEINVEPPLPEIKNEKKEEKPKFLFPTEENNLNFVEPKNFFQKMENNLTKITKRISLINENELYNTKKKSNYAKYLQSQNHFEKLQEKKNIKINLSEKVKLMKPRIDDLQLFLQEIEQKHKNLFKLVPKLLKNYKKVFNYKTKNNFSIPPKLYDDFEYFIKLYSSKKKSDFNNNFLKQFKKYDNNLIFLILLDYINYINIIKYHFKFFNNKNIAIDVFNIDKDYYENVFTNIKSNFKPKIVSFGNIKTNEKTLESKFQKFLYKQNKKNNLFIKKNESLISNNNINNISKEENFLNSYIKNLKNNEKSILNTLSSKFSGTKLSEKNSIYKMYGIKRIKNKNIFNSKIKKTKSFSNIKDTQFFNKKKIDNENEEEEDFYKNYSSSSSFDEYDFNDLNSNGSSYLDKKFIFEDKNSRLKKNKKFEVDIHKKSISKIFNKNERSLYDNIIINKLKRNIINSAYN